MDSEKTTKNNYYKKITFFLLILIILSLISSIFSFAILNFTNQEKNTETLIPFLPKKKKNNKIASIVPTISIIPN